MKSLQETKIEKSEWDNKLVVKRREYAQQKELLKKAILDLKNCKRLKNRTERELKFAKLMVEKLDRKIRGTPGKIRRWGKEHPGELINSLEVVKT